MKKMLAVAISNIAYMRVIFPEDAFSDRSVEDVKLKILKRDKSYPLASQVVDWINGVFDAIDKQYLRLLILGIQKKDSDPNTVLEMYTFKFAYTDTTEMEIYNKDRKISSSQSSSQTKKATVSMLRNLIALIQTLRPLPADACFTMKLFYYDNVTPKNYEPPGFRATEIDSVCVEGNPTKFRFHSVSTSFHSLQLKVVAETAATEDDAESVQGTQQTLESGMDVEMDDTPYQPGAMEDGSTEQTVAAADDGHSQVEESSSDVEPLGVRCPCLANEDDGLMILCAVCHYWQHAICFKVLDETSAPARHVCNLCCNSDDAPTDPDLTDIGASKVQMTCMWRRSLAACLEVDHINSAQLASRLGVANSVAGDLMKRLVSEGYVAAKGKQANATKFVQKRKIKREALVKYFRRNKVSAMETE